jgi:hypothetical protein
MWILQEKLIDKLRVSTKNVNSSRKIRVSTIQEKLIGKLRVSTKNVNSSRKINW